MKWNEWKLKCDTTTSVVVLRNNRAASRPREIFLFGFKNEKFTANNNVKKLRARAMWMKEKQQKNLESHCWTLNDRLCCPFRRSWLKFFYNRPRSSDGRRFSCHCSQFTSDLGFIFVAIFAQLELHTKKWKKLFFLRMVKKVWNFLMT